MGRKPKPLKRGTKPNASDDEIAALITQGKNNSEIARALRCDRKRVAALREITNSLNLPPLDTIRAVVRLELSQEETLNEFSDQLNEYTKNYRNAMSIGDDNAAGRWAVLRLKLLENMVKISGLDKRCELPPPDPQEALAAVPYEEVKRRALAILAQDQR